MKVHVKHSLKTDVAAAFKLCTEQKSQEQVYAKLGGSDLKIKREGRAPNVQLRISRKMPANPPAAAPTNEPASAEANTTLCPASSTVPPGTTRSMPSMLNPLMSSSHGLELKSSMNSKVRLVDRSGIGRGLYMISVIARPVRRLDGPVGSRSRDN